MSEGRVAAAVWFSIASLAAITALAVWVRGCLKRKARNEKTLWAAGELSGYGLLVCNVDPIWGIWSRALILRRSDRLYVLKAGRSGLQSFADFALTLIAPTSLLCLLANGVFDRGSLGSNICLNFAAGVFALWLIRGPGPLDRSGRFWRVLEAICGLGGEWRDEEVFEILGDHADFSMGPEEWIRVEWSQELFGRWELCLEGVRLLLCREEDEGRLSRLFHSDSLDCAGQPFPYR